eukprot:jgi/Mesvir1/17560/Mv08804-RA.2
MAVLHHLLCESLLLGLFFLEVLSATPPLPEFPQLPLLPSCPPPPSGQPWQGRDGGAGVRASTEGSPEAASCRNTSDGQADQAESCPLAPGTMGGDSAGGGVGGSRTPGEERGGDAGMCRQVKVCIVSSEFAGIVPNGGIGTFYSTLAQMLASQGEIVTLLYTQGTRSHHAQHGFDYWEAFYAAKNISLVALPSYRPPGVGYHTGTSYQVYDWLSQHAFDVVHFPDWQGHSYYSLLAKRHGLALSNTVLVIMVHGPLQWARASNGQPMGSLEDMEVDFMERQSVKLCDILVSPSRYLLNWIRSSGWDLPSPIPPAASVPAPSLVAAAPAGIPSSDGGSDGGSVGGGDGSGDRSRDGTSDRGQQHTSHAGFHLQQAPAAGFLANRVFVQPYLMPQATLVRTGPRATAQGRLVAAKKGQVGGETGAQDGGRTGVSSADQGGGSQEHEGMPVVASSRMPCAPYADEKGEAGGREARELLGLVPPPQKVAVSELVFFGRLEFRKGAVLFCDALDAILEARSPPGAGRITAPRLPRQVTFMGSARNTILGVDSVEYLRRRAERWGGAWEVSILTDKDSSGAMEYLRGEGRLALLPSVVENSPLSILECLRARIPFVASTAGGIPEQVCVHDHAHVLFEPEVPALIEALTRALQHGVVLARPAFEMAANEQHWLRWHRQFASVRDGKCASAEGGQAACGARVAGLVHQGSLGTRLTLRRPVHPAGTLLESGATEAAAAAPPTLSILLPWHEDARSDLRVSVLSLLQQQPPLPAWGAQVQIILVEVVGNSDEGVAGARGTSANANTHGHPSDGLGTPTRDPEDILELAARKRAQDAMGSDIWQAIEDAGLMDHIRFKQATGPGMSVAAARNLAANASQHASYHLFLDAGCLLESDAVMAFVKVAVHTGADVVTSLAQFYAGSMYTGLVADAMVRGSPAGLGAHPSATTAYIRRQFHIPLGPSLAVGALRNCFGGPVVLVSAAVFSSLRGFSEDMSPGLDVWDMLARAALQGMSMEHVPRALFWSTVPAGVFAARARPPEEARVLRPYLLQLSPEQRAQVLAGGCPSLQPYLGGGGC